MSARGSRFLAVHPTEDDTAASTSEWLAARAVVVFMPVFNRRVGMFGEKHVNFVGCASLKRAGRVSTDRWFPVLCVQSALKTTDDGFVFCKEGTVCGEEIVYAACDVETKETTTAAPAVVSAPPPRVWSWLAAVSLCYGVVGILAFGLFRLRRL